MAWRPAGVPVVQLHQAADRGSPQTHRWDAAAEAPVLTR